MADAKSPVKPSNDIVAQVAERIKNSSNVLIALSKDPSVDELSAAIGLSFLLDELGKHATAIFSGAIPNAIEFLEPEKTFEPNTNSLQDFIIALDKEKADHLRYKIDGDYVKVYITPYRTTIDESDLEFSHGDFNVDLVIALNVPATANLDAALSQYGRIMHDASSINITAGAPGHFGDLEWGDPAASSVSEMIYNLANRLKSKESLVNKAIATALLAGIVAATNRFSNEHTTPATMSVASQLMIAGADQQLISASIPTELVAPMASEAVTEPVPVQDPSHLSVNHTNSASTPTANTATPEEQTLSQKSETSVEEPNTEAEPQGELDIQQQPEEAPESDKQEETPEQQLEKIIQKPADNLEGSGKPSKRLQPLMLQPRLPQQFPAQQKLIRCPPSTMVAYQKLPKLFLHQRLQLQLHLQTCQRRIFVRPKPRYLIQKLLLPQLQCQRSQLPHRYRCRTAMSCLLRHRRLIQILLWAPLISRRPFRLPRFLPHLMQVLRTPPMEPFRLCPP